MLPRRATTPWGIHRSSLQLVCRGNAAIIPSRKGFRASGRLQIVMGVTVCCQNSYAWRSARSKMEREHKRFRTVPSRYQPQPLLCPLWQKPADCNKVPAPVRGYQDQESHDHHRQVHIDRNRGKCLDDSAEAAAVDMTSLGEHDGLGDEEGEAHQTGAQGRKTRQQPEEQAESAEKLDEGHDEAEGAGQYHGQHAEVVDRVHRVTFNVNKLAKRREKKDHREQKPKYQDQEAVSVPGVCFQGEFRMFCDRMHLRPLRGWLPRGSGLEHVGEGGIRLFSDCIEVMSGDGMLDDDQGHVLDPLLVHRLCEEFLEGKRDDGDGRDTLLLQIELVNYQPRGAVASVSL